MRGRLIPKSDRKKIHEYLFRGKLLSSLLHLLGCGSWWEIGGGRKDKRWICWNRLDGIERKRLGLGQHGNKPQADIFAKSRGSSRREEGLQPPQAPGH